MTIIVTMVCYIVIYKYKISNIPFHTVQKWSAEQTKVETERGTLPVFEFEDHRYIQNGNTTNRHTTKNRMLCIKI